MRKYNRAEITAAFTTMARAADTGKPILYKELGLNPRNACLFMQAVTHSFKKDKHGIELHRVFIQNEARKNLYHRNTTPNNNPKDASLIDLIMAAMTIVGKTRKATRTAESVSQCTESTNPLEKLSNKELFQEIGNMFLELARRL